MNLTQEQAMEIASRKARRHDAISPAERDMIIAQLERFPLPVVKRNTGRSYVTLLRIAQVAL
ncbi:hypothetical protein [Sphingobium sp. YR768]|uniref:hypothetical protein n=1 Tax=Sphingobium sp. YR768 TaxID=1884365 RepID=UPI0008C642A0|nr:hypothetical protein [Sphingobium sp. YR768]SES08210.1 hypothetical protein SAMN05518866_13721 [Sphingobium sp. YR768]